MPVGVANWPEIQIANDALEERLQSAQVSERRRVAAVSLDDPLNSVHPRTLTAELDRNWDRTC